MPLDPQAKAFLDQIVAIGGPSLTAVPVDEARKMMEMLSALRGAEVLVASAVDRTIRLA